MQKPSFFKRNWYFFTPLIIIAIPMLMAVNAMVNWGYKFDESMKALMHFGSTDTRYSIGFSEDHFRRIRPGMDGKTVYKIVKNPFERQANDSR